MTFSLIGRDTSSRVFDSIIAVNRREQGPYFTFNNSVFLERGLLFTLSLSSHCFYSVFHLFQIIFSRAYIL